MSQALGMLETVGLTALVEASDAMSKAANVVLLAWDRVGAGLVTVFCQGDVAAVKAALDAGAASAAGIGQVHSVHAIPRPHDDLGQALPRRSTATVERAPEPCALGLVETRGATGMIEAGDAMCKTANVDIVKIQQIGGGLVTAMVNGDVGSVMAAVNSGAEAADRVGELVSQHVIPRPSDDVVALFIASGSADE